MSIGPNVERPNIGRNLRSDRARIEAMERHPDLHTLLVVMDAGTALLTTGDKCDIQLHRRYEIRSWTLLANTAGDIVVDIWKETDIALYPPSVTGTITGGNPPLLVSEDAFEETNLTGWTTRIDAGDMFRFNIDSVSGINRVTLNLKLLGL